VARKRGKVGYLSAAGKETGAGWLMVGLIRHARPYFARSVLRMNLSASVMLGLSGSFHQRDVFPQLEPTELVLADEPDLQRP
jgi:hypothetical protein